MYKIRTKLQGDTPFFPNMLNNGKVEVCLKEDVDKALAEKDKVIAHQKYKRCMAMKYVEWLKQIIIGLHPESILYCKAFKRERKWKELAEKFKPSNEE